MKKVFGILILVCGLLLVLYFLYSPFKKGTDDLLGLNDNTNNVAIVLGKTANVPMVDGDELSNEIINYLDENDLLNSKLGKITLIGVDGDQTADELFNYSPKDNQCSLDSNSPKKEEACKKTISEKITNAVNEYTPKANHADYLNAIEKAARDFAKDGTIFVVGSGLSDKGDFNFADNNYIYTEEKPEINDAVDLGYADIIWYNIGQSVSPQQILKQPQTDKIKDLYQRLLEKFGGDDHNGELTVTFDKINTIKNDGKEYAVDTPYFVSTSPTEAEQQVWEMVFDGSEISFEPDSTDYSNKDKAMQNIQKVADYYKNHSNDYLIEITGTQALTSEKITAPEGSPEADISRRRAEKVKNTLVNDMNVNSNDIVKVVGAGTSSFQYSDELENGRWNDELAQKHRLVIIKLTKKDK